MIKGLVKPGSRNISVREIAASEQRKLAAPRARSNGDYLADAARTLAEAEALTGSEATPTGGS